MRDVTRRLYDYVELIVLPRVASQLGSGWEAAGLVLSTPNGRDLAVSIDLGYRPSDPPKLLVRRPLQPELPIEQNPFVEVLATASPHQIAHVLREELCSRCGDRGDTSDRASAEEGDLDSDPGLP